MTSVGGSSRGVDGGDGLVGDLGRSASAVTGSSTGCGSPVDRLGHGSARRLAARRRRARLGTGDGLRPRPRPAPAPARGRSRRRRRRTAGAASVRAVSADVARASGADDAVGERAGCDASADAPSTCTTTSAHALEHPLGPRAHLARAPHVLPAADLDDDLDVTAQRGVHALPVDGRPRANGGRPPKPSRASSAERREHALARRPARARGRSLGRAGAEQRHEAGAHDGRPVAGGVLGHAHDGISSFDVARRPGCASGRTRGIGWVADRSARDRRAVEHLVPDVGAQLRPGAGHGDVDVVVRAGGGGDVDDDGADVVAGAGVERAAGPGAPRRPAGRPSPPGRARGRVVADLAREPVGADEQPVVQAGGQQPVVGLRRRHRCRGRASARAARGASRPRPGRARRGRAAPAPPSGRRSPARARRRTTGTRGSRRR